MAGPPDPAALESARRLEKGGRADEAARAYVQAGAIEDGVRVMRGCGRLDAAARMLSDAGLLLEAAECHVEAGDAAAGLERLLRVAPRDPRYREAARIAVRLACQLDTLGVRFEQFVGSFIAAGAEGVISVASNLVPREVSALVSAALSGDATKARELHYQLYPLFKDLFIEPNPVPVKHALALLGQMKPDVRLPLCEMGDATRAKLEATLHKLQLIPP